MPIDFLAAHGDVQSIPTPAELEVYQRVYWELARDAFLVNLFSVAALTWLTYDMVLNFSREVTLVWKRWHEPKGRHSRRLYMIVRYFSVFALAWYVAVNTSAGLSLNFCRAWYYIVVVNTTIITLLPDAMLLIRVNAVYGWNIRTLLFTSFLFMTQMTTSLVAGILAVTTTQIGLPNTLFFLSPAPSLPGCPASILRPVAQFTLLAWIPSILAQLTYLLLMLNTLAHLMRGLDDVADRAVDHAGGISNSHGKTNPISEYSQSGLSWRALMQVRTLVPTMMVFVGHGGVYFGLAILAKVVNAVMVTTQSGPLQALAIPWTMALYPVLVTRIYLSMVQYLHFRVPMKRPHLLASYDGENYFGSDSEETIDDGDEGDYNDGDRDRREEENSNLQRGRTQRRPGLGRITFAVRDSESLASLASRRLRVDAAVLDFRDGEY